MIGRHSYNNSNSHAQQQRIKEHAHPQPSSERKFRGKRRSPKTKGTDDDAFTRTNKWQIHDRTSIGAEKAFSEEKSKRKPTVRVVFRLSWTTPVYHRGISPAGSSGRGLLQQSKKRTAEALSKRWITS
jgi:hypothetical protein